MNSWNKVWGRGDALYLYRSNKDPIRYVVEDIAIFRSQTSGTDYLGVLLSELGKVDSVATSYYVIEDLLNRGEMWVATGKGREKMAEFLREKYSNA